MKNKIAIIGVVIAFLTLLFSFYQEINNKNVEKSKKITTGNKSPIVSTEDGKVELNY